MYQGSFLLPLADVTSHPFLDTFHATIYIFVPICLRQANACQSLRFTLLLIFLGMCKLLQAGSEHIKAHQAILLAVFNSLLPKSHDGSERARQRCAE